MTITLLEKFNFNLFSWHPKFQNVLLNLQDVSERLKFFPMSGFYLRPWISLNLQVITDYQFFQSFFWQSDNPVAPPRDWHSRRFTELFKCEKTVSGSGNPDREKCQPKGRRYENGFCSLLTEEEMPDIALLGTGRRGNPKTWYRYVHYSWAWK